MRVLMTAYVCNPTRGSEAGVGWALASAAAAHHDVTLLTQSIERADIEAARRASPSLAAALTPVYFDLPGVAGQREGRGTRVHHHRWQRRLVPLGRRLHSERRFDVAHHATFATDADVAGATMVADDLPSVWGPVGGATGITPTLWPFLGWRGALDEVVRAGRGAVLRKAYGEGNARRARLTVAANATTRDRFARVGRIEVEPTAMLPAMPFELASRGAPAEQRRAVFAGRLLPWKGTALAVMALAEPPARQWTLDIFGAGPDEARCRALAERLGVQSRVWFGGEVPRVDLLKHLADADALLFPSLREQTGWVVAEALSVGTPVVCIDRGGPPSLLRGAGEGHGTAVAPGRHLVRRLAEALDATSQLSRTPTNRWSIERMPSTLDRWYQLAVSTPIGGT